MGAFSTNMQAMATRLLTKYGQEITFTRYTSNEYNVDTGGVDPVTSTTYAAFGHLQLYTLDEIDGENIQFNDVALLIYPTTAPAIEDVASIDGDNYRVMNVAKTKAQGDVVLYRLQLRK